MKTILSYIAAAFYVFLGWGLLGIHVFTEQAPLIGGKEDAALYPYMIGLCCIGSALLIYAWIENGFSLDFPDPLESA